MLQLGVFTTRELTPDGHEYQSKELDPRGEEKVDAEGHLRDGREYRIRTFRLPGRGQKLFMLGAECAKELGYRDSYLLFNKNKNLYKILCGQDDKDHLIATNLLPAAFRTRAIAVVSARSVFRQFGSRVIRDGRRVKDDYWETKAIEQGFTEHDPVIVDKSSFSTNISQTVEVPETSDVSHVNQPLLLGGVFIPGSGINGSIDFHEPVGSSSHSHNHHHHSGGSSSSKKSSAAALYEAQHNVSQFNKYLNEQRKLRTGMWGQFWTLRQQQKDHLLENGVRELLGNISADYGEESMHYQQQYQQIQQSLVRPTRGVLEGPPPPVYTLPDPPSVQKQQQQQQGIAQPQQQRRPMPPQPQQQQPHPVAPAPAQPQPTPQQYSQYAQQLQAQQLQKLAMQQQQQQQQQQWMGAVNNYG